MASKASRRRQRWASDAAMQALVRYGPEQSGLKALERQAKSTYETTVKTSRGSAQTIIGEVDRARPEVKHNYDKAGLDAARAAHAVSDPVIQNLGPAAGSLKAAAMLERSGLAGRLAEGRATALTDLSQRRVQAVQGAQFAQSNARDTLVSELQKVFERSQDLRREKGAFAAATVGQLRDAAMDRAQQLHIENLGNRSAERRARQQARQQERSSKRTAGIDPDTGQPIKNGPLDPKSPRYKGKSNSKAGPYGLTPYQEQQRVRQVRQTSKKAVRRVETAAELYDRYRQTKVEDPPDSGKWRYPKPGEIYERLIGEKYDKREVDVARDLLRNKGRLSQRGVKAAHDLDIRVPKRWRPPRQKPGLQGIAGIRG